MSITDEEKVLQTCLQADLMGAFLHQGSSSNITGCVDINELEGSPASAHRELNWPTRTQCFKFLETAMDPEMKSNCL